MHRVHFAVVLLSNVLCLAAASAQAQVNGTWNGATDANWATATNWAGGVAPGANVADTATFNNAGNGRTTITISGTKSLNDLTFDTAAAAAYTLTGGTINLAATADHGITFGSGLTNDQAIGCRLALQSGNATITNNSAAKILTLTGGVSGTGRGLTKAGPGTLVIGSTANNNGDVLATGPFVVNGGVVQVQRQTNVPSVGTLSNCSSIIINNGGTLHGNTYNTFYGYRSTGWITGTPVITVNAGGLLSCSMSQELKNVQLNGGAIGGASGSYTLWGTVTAGASSTMASINAGGTVWTTSLTAFNVEQGTSPSGIDLNVSAYLTGSPIIKNGAGTMRVAGANTSLAGATINAGTLIVGNPSALGTSGAITNSGTLAIGAGVLFSRPVAWNANSTLAGSGTYQNAVSVPAGGFAISPGIGAGNTGVLTIQDNALTLNANTHFVVDIKGLTAGAGYDQLRVSSATAKNVVLAGTLDINWGEFTPAGNDVLVIVDNSTTGTTSGAFQYAEGQSLGAHNGKTWYITYHADGTTGNLSGGNDVAIYNGTPVESLPMVFHCTETARPGDVIGLQGDRFGSSPQVWMQHVTGTESFPSPKVRLTVLNNVTDKYVSALIPATETSGLYAVWVKNGSKLSAVQYLNRARAMNANDLCGAEIDPGRSFRLFGRNLYFPGATPTVTFCVGSLSLAATVTIAGSDPYQLNVTAPAGIVPGIDYTIRLNNGYGGNYGNFDCEFTLTTRAAGTDVFGLGVPWGADFTFAGNVYNVKTDSRLSPKAMGDGVTDDSVAIQNAINVANGAGGGVVYFPAGTYKTVMNSAASNYACLDLRSNVVLQGAGMTASTIMLNNGTPASGYGTGLGTYQRSMLGFVDIGFYNALNGAPTGISDRLCSKTFALRTKFQYDAGKNAWFRTCDRLVVKNCVFVQNLATGQYGEVVWFLDNTNAVFRDNTVTYYFGRIKMMNSSNTLVENNYCTRIGINNGVLYESGGFDFSSNDNLVLQNNTLVRGGTDLCTQNNDGEVIMAQDNVFHNDVGTVTSTASASVTDSSQSWTFNYGVGEAEFGHQPYYLAIVSGTGAGQLRKVTASTSNTLTVSPPWDVIPSAGAHFSLTMTSRRNIIKNNLLSQQPQGLMTYAIPIQDIVIANNTLSDNGGIWLMTRYDTRGAPYEAFKFSMDTLVVGNTVADYLALYTWTDSYARIMIQAYGGGFGTGTYGDQVRNNTLIAPSPNRTDEGYNLDSSGGAVSALGTIYQGNKSVNTATAYRVSSSGDYCTVIWDSILQNVTTLLSNSGISTVTGPAAPRGLYAFEGNVNDSSGNNKNGVNYSATFVTGTIGAKAAKFNGTTAYVRVPRTISTNFSIACWVKTSQAAYGGGQWYNGKGLIDGYVSPTANDFGTAVVAGKFAFGVGNPKTTLASTASINNGAWHHVAATRDSASGQMRVYVDGVLSNSRATGPMGTRSAASFLRIGSLQTGASGTFFNGIIDDARVYDYVLSAAEVAALYNRLVN